LGLFGLTSSRVRCRRVMHELGISRGPQTPDVIRHHRGQP
jgi:hypothetical protein